MSMDSLRTYLRERLNGKYTRKHYALGELTLEVPVTHWRDVCNFLRHDEATRFEQLTDLCGVDYLAYGDSDWDVMHASSTGFSRASTQQPPVDPFDFADDQVKPPDPARRFAVVIHLLSVRHNLRIRLRTFCEDADYPLVPSLVGVWRCADWYEREAFDLFGIMFEGHPDLRRILTDYGFVGHPFRKDFPLIGQVEMRYDPLQQRVIYEPVSIEPRTLVPRVIREDERFIPPEELDD